MFLATEPILGLPINNQPRIVSATPGLEAVFLFLKNFKPGGPLGISPAALSILKVIKVRQMIEAVIVILGLFSAILFIAYAVDAYRS